MAAAGLSAVFFQDQFGLITFDERFHAGGGGAAADRPLARDLLPRPVQSDRAATDTRRPGSDIIVAIESHLRKASLVPVISDFLFPDARA